LKVAFTTPEIFSLVRRTNLAEISEFLPKTLHALGADVRVFMPLHGDLAAENILDLAFAGDVVIPEDRGELTLKVYTATLAGTNLPLVMFDHAELFRNRHPYGDDNGPYADNWRRYAAFARGVLASFELLRFSPSVIHCMDWTSGLIPLFQELEYRSQTPTHPAAKAGTYFALHNLAMQGTFEREILPKIGVPLEYFRSVEGLELGGRVNFLKAGIEFATIVGSHSPNQALRLQSEERGDGLDESFKRRKKELVGVLTGIDYRAWDPGTDMLLAQPYSLEEADPLKGKRKCKATLQEGLRLAVEPRTPVISIIGRFDSDNGFDLLAEAITPILERSTQLIMMGPGQPEVLERLRTVEQTFSNCCRVLEGYNINTAHTLMGGSDILLLPGHFHPSNSLCAIAMRYGTVPIAYGTSGLEDTINDIQKDPKNGTGLFFDHYGVGGLLTALDEARSLFKKSKDWKMFVRRCMEEDFSWRESARNHLLAYRRVTRRARPGK